MADRAQLHARFWAIIPAAGSARRMGGEVPKQYLQLAGRSVIEWAIAPFLTREDCAGVIVVLGPRDGHWKSLAISRREIITTTIGAADRAGSVRNGLAALCDRARSSDWVLVHDAARPCLSNTDLAKLLDEVAGDDVGGLLASPVVDTLKCADEAARAVATVDRSTLWRALTPQMFRYEILTRALRYACEKNVVVTDESQAVELLGYRPRLVAGSAQNIKITLPEDLARAEQILKDSGSGW